MLSICKQYCYQLKAIDMPLQSMSCPGARDGVPVAYSGPPQSGCISCDNNRAYALTLVLRALIEKQGLTMSWISNNRLISLANIHWPFLILLRGDWAPRWDPITSVIDVMTSMTSWKGTLLYLLLTYLVFLSVSLLRLSMCVDLWEEKLHKECKKDVRDTY